ncbi:hypothetical protein BaRGS_00001641 [Batillaria attramentaria]|uniref:Uncharacterized protein n=1 Tax=Batillaria attramentaria TaxID=370345 RepID=A0ABD0M8K8_9CAEN
MNEVDRLNQHELKVPAGTQLGFNGWEDAAEREQRGPGGARTRSPNKPTGHTGENAAAGALPFPPVILPDSAPWRPHPRASSPADR